MSIKSQLKDKLFQQAVELVKEDRFLDACQIFEQSRTVPDKQTIHKDKFAYSFYRRALFHQQHRKENQAINDLEKALKFPNVPKSIQTLIQQRLTVIRKGAIPEIKKFDKAIEQEFGRYPSEDDLLKKFVSKYGLSQASKVPNIEGIDEISAIGVYRWVGDVNRHEQWSKLIRKFKAGDRNLPAFFARILEEHVNRTQVCQTWVQQVDYIVPIPSAANRNAERGINILETVAIHLSSRLKIPLRTDFLKRKQSSEHSRFLKKADLKSQYSIRKKISSNIEGTTLLMLDDVVNRGYTAGTCAELLRENECAKIFFLVLAISESTNKSNMYLE